MTRLGTLILEQDKVDTIPINYAANTNATGWNTQPFIFIKFTGCNTGTIGTMYIRVSASI